MSMITGSWKDTVLLCSHCAAHGAETPMTLSHTHKGIVFECASDKCNNTITQYEFEKMLDHLAKTIMKAEMNGEIFVMTGYRWKYKMHEYAVLKQSEDGFVVSVRDLQKKDV